MQTWSRRRVETIVLAFLGMAAVVPFRFYAEPRGWFLTEMVCVCMLFAFSAILQSWLVRLPYCKFFVRVSIACLCATPIVFAILARAFGSPIPFEISALATFGAAALGMAAAKTTPRVWSLSLVTSGFLVLFCAAISDKQDAVALPLLWMLICVWHLVANRWETLDLAMPESVERSWSLRPRIIIIALVVLIIGGYAIKHQLPSTKRFEFGFMPTSGGNGWTDPAARSGVGTGDQAIAAKDHAESFGAVDSDIFLESKESTLFDMFSDSLGPPKKQKNIWERRQGMGNENVIPMHEKAAKTDQGGSSFSTERLPTKKKHEVPTNAPSNSVVQWDGPTGIRLAMNRYDKFDGHEWTQSADLSEETLTRIDISDAPWFFDPSTRDSFLSSPKSVSVGLLKIIRLDSQRLPVPMLTAGIHIKEIVRQDFFALEKDGCFYMPGREKVPPLTVVHVATGQLMEDEIRAGLETANDSDISTQAAETLAPATAEMIKTIIEPVLAEHGKSTDQLTACIEKLRTEFAFDRQDIEAAGSLTEFLASRRGGDHLFATTAALIANQLGLTSRLVTGFYVRPDAYEITAGHACVLPNDVHVWAEVQLTDGRWFEIEPTPGYVQPHYKPSWGLLARKLATAHWPLILTSMVSLVIVYASRRFWLDLLLSTVWFLSRWLRPRQRIRLALKIIETRAHLAGSARPAGRSQRAWLEDLTRADLGVATATKRFADSADCLFFGHGHGLAHQDALQLVSLLRVRTIMSLKHSTQA